MELAETWRDPVESGTWQHLAEPGGNLAEPSGRKVSWRGGGRSKKKTCQKSYWFLLPTTPPFNLPFSAVFRKVSAGLRRVPPGSAGFPAPTGSAGFPPARALLMADYNAKASGSRQLLRRFLPNPHPELSAQHCLPERWQLLEQLCCEIKVRATNLLERCLCDIMKTWYAPGVRQWTIEAMPGASQLGSK